MDKITLRVEGMSCGHCKAAVEKALKELNGVQDADVELVSKSVIVTYDSSKVKWDDLAGAITDAGYKIKD